MLCCFSCLPWYRLELYSTVCAVSCTPLLLAHFSHQPVLPGLAPLLHSGKSLADPSCGFKPAAVPAASPLAVSPESLPDRTMQRLTCSNRHVASLNICLIPNWVLESFTVLEWISLSSLFKVIFLDGSCYNDHRESELKTVKNRNWRSLLSGDKELLSFYFPLTETESSQFQAEEVTPVFWVIIEDDSVSVH